VFDSFADAETRAAGRRWLRWTVVLSALAHVVGALFFVAGSFWKVDKLEVRHVPVSFARKSGSPAKASLAAAQAQPTASRPPEKRRPHRLVQPSPDVPVVPTPPTDDGAASPSPGDTGTGGSESAAGAQGDGTGQGGTSENATPTPPPLPEPPVFVPQAVLKESRLFAPEPRLGDDVIMLLAKQEVRELSVTVHMCLSTAGLPTTLTFKKKSGFELVDQRIEAVLRTWRFRPFQVGGKPVVRCTFWTLKYRIE
jgi:protein TonB